MITENNDFGRIGNEFINLYSEENPLLNINDTCFFMFNNTTDYHRPLIAQGIVVYDKFTDGLNKIYYIRINEIIESPKIQQEFLLNKSFYVIPMKDDVLLSKKISQISMNFDFSCNLFPITAFFVRTSIEKINKIRQEYIQLIKQDIEKMLSDVCSI